MLTQFLLLMFSKPNRLCFGTHFSLGRCHLSLSLAFSSQQLRSHLAAQAPGPWGFLYLALSSELLPISSLHRAACAVECLMCRASCAVRSCACTNPSQRLEWRVARGLLLLVGSRSSHFQLIPPLKSDEAAHRKCDILSTAPVILGLSVPSAR